MRKVVEVLSQTLMGGKYLHPLHRPLSYSLDKYRPDPNFSSLEKGLGHEHCQKLYNAKNLLRRLWCPTRISSLQKIHKGSVYS